MVGRSLAALLMAVVAQTPAPPAPSGAHSYVDLSHAQAAEAVKVAGAALAHTGFVSSSVHWGLWQDLNAIVLAARAVQDDHGSTAALLQPKVEQLTRSMVQTLALADAISKRAIETPVDQDNARQLRDALQALQTSAALAERTASAAAMDRMPWGDPVNGLALQLAISASRPSLPGDLPSFDVRVRNQSTARITFDSRAVLDLDYPAISIDGVWYRQLIAVTSSPAPLVLAPGETSRIIVTALQHDVLGPADGPPRAPGALHIDPGRHDVRARFTATPQSDQNPTRQSVTLISNAITCDIEVLSSDAEERVLVDQTSAGGFEAFDSARRLVARYPNAAPSALGSAIDNTPMPETRRTYIELLSSIPGDASATILWSVFQSPQDAATRMQAGTALIRRGDPDVAPLAIAEWRALLRGLAGGAGASNGLGPVMLLLAHSGSPDAVAALGDDRDAPLDIRLSVPVAFLPSQPTRLSTAPGRPFAGAIFFMPLPTAGPPDALERLSINALDDRESRAGLTLGFGDETYVDPRVCDLAARVLATRWPDRYRFNWSDDVATRDREIAALQDASRAAAPQSPR